MKPSTTKLKPTTLMARDETLRSVYARNAPDVPDWFLEEICTRTERIEAVYFNRSIELTEEIYIKWLEYYSELMLKHFGK